MVKIIAVYQCGSVKLALDAIAVNFKSLIDKALPHSIEHLHGDFFVRKQGVLVCCFRIDGGSEGIAYLQVFVPYRACAVGVAEDLDGEECNVIPNTALAVGVLVPKLATT